MAAGGILGGLIKGYTDATANAEKRAQEKEQFALQKKLLDAQTKKYENDALEMQNKATRDQRTWDFIDRLFGGNPQGGTATAPTAEATPMSHNLLDTIVKGQAGGDMPTPNMALNDSDSLLEQLSDPRIQMAAKMMDIDLSGPVNTLRQVQEYKALQANRAELNKRSDEETKYIDTGLELVGVDRMGRPTGQRIPKSIKMEVGAQANPDGSQNSFLYNPYTGGGAPSLNLGGQAQLGGASPMSWITKQKEGMAADKASTLTNAIGAKDNMQQIKPLLLPNGKVDMDTYSTLLASAFKVPWTKGRELNSLLQDTAEVKIRLESGAAVPDSELKRLANRLIPQWGDTHELIVDKLDRMERYLNGVVEKMDPNKRYDTSVEIFTDKTGQKYVWQPAAESSGMVAENAMTQLPSINTQEEFNKLPSGTTYLNLKTGQMGTKP